MANMLTRNQFSLRSLVWLLVACNVYSAFAAWALPHFAAVHLLSTPTAACLMALVWARRKCDATWSDANFIAIAFATLVSALAFGVMIGLSGGTRVATAGRWINPALGMAVLMGVVYGFVMSVISCALFAGAEYWAKKFWSRFASGRRRTSP